MTALNKTRTAERQTRAGQTLAAFALAAVAALAGCQLMSSASGSFDKILQVNGPVRLEVANGSGKTVVSAGPPGEVSIHADFRVRGWSSRDVRSRVAELRANPPVRQQNNLIQLGQSLGRGHIETINYTITVPAETELRAATGSGEVQITGIHGPLNLATGSGNIRAMGIAKDVLAAAGSGDISLNGIQGNVQATAGSGDISLTGVRGETRARSGSGDISITGPFAAVIADTGSGDVTATYAVADLRLHTGSGDLTVQGNPAANSYWALHTGSGTVTLNLPPSASFRLRAHSTSGGIETSLPIVVEEQTSKHELRARVGDGKARLDVETSSGSIRLR